MNITLTLPKDAELHIKNGDQIDFGDKFFSVYSSELVTINVAEKLHIKPETIFHYLNKIIGEEIKKDEIIALKKNGLMTHKIVSDYNGRLKEIDHHTGAIILNVNTEDQNEIKAQFKGEIEEIKDNKINIKIKNGTSVALKNVSSDAYGEIFHFDSESLYFSVTEEDIKNKIICIEELKNHIQAKYNALGSIGFIYLKGDVSSSLPTAQFKTVDDYETIKKTKKKYIIFSVADKTAIVYD